MTTLDQYVKTLKIPAPNTADICEHLDTLTKYASECNHVTEMGFRTGTSFAALLLAQPETLITYDLYVPAFFKKTLESLKGKTHVEFYEASSLNIDIAETDLLFIDTLHTYDQLKAELSLHASKAKKYIALHDTVTFGRKGEDHGDKGLLNAVEEFLEANPEWSFCEHFTNNNGLTVLKREPCNSH